MARPKPGPAFRRRARSSTNRSRRRRNRTRQRGPARQSSLSGAVKKTASSLFVKGVRTLISVLPGQQVLKPISDFIFGSSNSGTNSNGVGDAYQIGLQAAFTLSLKDFLVDNPSLGVQSSDNHWSTNYEYGCLRDGTVTAVPTAMLGKRNGNWTMSCVLLKDSSDDAETGDFFKARPYNDVVSMPGAVTGPASVPLILQFKPTARDGRAFQRSALGTPIVRVFIAFSSTDRADSDKQVPIDNFGCDIQVTGNLDLSMRTETIKKFDRKLPNPVTTNIFHCGQRTISIDDDGSTIEEQYRKAWRILEEEFEYLDSPPSAEVHGLKI